MLSKAEKHFCLYFGVLKTHQHLPGISRPRGPGAVGFGRGAHEPRETTDAVSTARDADTEAQRQRREQRAGSIAGRLMSDFLGVHDDSQPPPEIKVKVRHNRHRGRAGKVTPDEWASEKGSDSEGSADVLNQIHRRLRDLSPNPVRPPRPEAPPFEA